VLYTVVPREDKYKSKNVIDTFVYRGGDQVGAWSYDGFLALGLSSAAICFSIVPLAAGWFVVALLLGRRQQSLAGAG
ncbi:MAG: MFS transporter, partial [Planctomycetota bacterium]|jgi:AAA family ATP:ADP antiporter